MKSHAAAPLLIALPKGFSASGVVMWAVRLANALAARGRPAALIVHVEPRDQAPLDMPLSPGVELIDLREKFPADAAAERCAPFLPFYADAVRRLSDRAAAPVVISPNLLGDCYALAAALCVTESHRTRILGVQHADIEYDARVLSHYEPVIARFVGVSDHLATTLHTRIPHRAADIEFIPHAIETPPAPPPRAPFRRRPLRLIYTGRIEHAQKRVTALLRLSEELTRRSIDHELALIGDGPALPELRTAARSTPHVRLEGPLPPAQVTQRLDASDIFILASRYEGLSVSMLEAMSRACWPIVTGVASGAADVIEQGISGELAVVGEQDDDAALARHLADAVERFLAAPDPAALSRAAWDRIRRNFSMDSHAKRYSAAIDAAAASPARPWPIDRPAAFTTDSATAAGGSGAVPLDGPARLRALLAALAGRRIILHAAGRHTIELASILATSPATIVALTDDDQSRWNTSLLGWRILPPSEASSLNATDVILSSWMHQESMWRRRAVFEQQGLRVHRIYPSVESSSTSSARRTARQ